MVLAEMEPATVPAGMLILGLKGLICWRKTFYEVRWQAGLVVKAGQRF